MRNSVCCFVSLIPLEARDGGMGVGQGLGIIHELRGLYSEIFGHLHVFPAHISVHHMFAQCPWRPEEVFRSLEYGVSGSCKSPYGCWDSNPCPPEEQLELLTTNSSLQPHISWSIHICRSVQPGFKEPEAYIHGSLK